MLITLASNSMYSTSATQKQQDNFNNAFGLKPAEGTRILKRLEGFSKEKMVNTAALDTILGFLKSADADTVAKYAGKPVAKANRAVFLALDKAKTLEVTLNNLKKIKSTGIVVKSKAPSTGSSLEDLSPKGKSNAGKSNVDTLVTTSATKLRAALTKMYGAFSISKVRVVRGAVTGDLMYKDSLISKVVMDTAGNIESGMLPSLRSNKQAYAAYEKLSKHSNFSYDPTSFFGSLLTDYEMIERLSKKLSGDKAFAFFNAKELGKGMNVLPANITLSSVRNGLNASIQGILESTKDQLVITSDVLDQI